MKYLLSVLFMILPIFANAQDVWVKRQTVGNPGSLPQQGTFWSLHGYYLRNQIQNSTSFPLRTHGQIVTTGASGARCSGSLIGPRHVLTNAHCVFDAKTGMWVQDITFYPGRLDETNLPYNPVSWEKIYIPKAYFTNTERKVDYAIIVLDKSVGESLGWQGLAFSDEVNHVTITGYPVDKPLGTLWKVDCPSLAKEGRVIFQCDTYNGMSGSPLVTKVDSEDLIVGIHAWGDNVSAGESGYNSGVHFNAKIFAQLKSWLNGTPSPFDTATFENPNSGIKVFYRNLCQKSPSINIWSHFHQPTGHWAQSSSWLELPRNGVIQLGTVSPKTSLYFYAVSNSLTWGGDSNQKADGKVLPFVKKKPPLGEELRGIYVNSFSCP